MLRKFYLTLGAVIVLGYSVTGLMGWEYGNPKRGIVPKSVRQKPGGYRSFHYWHTGFRGGK